MRTLLRSSIALGIVLLVVFALHSIDRSLRSNIDSSAAHKPLFNATATVLSVSPLAKGIVAHMDAPLERLCFSIDSFAGVAPQDRTFYETRERARYAVDGPLCRNVHVPNGAAEPKPGDHLDVRFMFENGGVIAPARLSLNGQVLYP